MKYVWNRMQKIHVFGALSTHGAITKLSPKINGRKFLSFLKRLHKRHRKLCIVIDNARWHLTKEVMHYVGAHRIKMIRLLPYSPELNPIEQYWKNIKGWLGTREFYNKEQLNTQLKKALRADILMPRISDY